MSPPTARPLIARLSRAISADLHALLDAIEDPHTLLRQGLRDMRLEIDDLETRAARLGEACQSLEARLAEARARSGPLEASLGVCLSDGREDLARAVVRDQLLLAHRLETLETTLTGRRREQQRVDERLAACRAELEAIVARARPFHAGDPDQEPAPRPPAAETGSATKIRDSDVEIALLAAVAARRQNP